MTYLLALALATNPAIEAEYTSLNPTSLVEHLAFYELYKETQEGQNALRDAHRLLFQEESDIPFSFPASSQSFIELINPGQSAREKEASFSDETYALIYRAGAKLANRTKKGFSITAAKEIKTLAPEEIDLSQALFLELLGEDRKQARYYSAQLDLMALVILSKLPQNATQEQKIMSLCDLVFHEFGFRFPPDSTHEAAIDRYTDLPSVLSSRRGVCLGVSTLLLAIGDRIGLNLDIYTPPGHIFLSSGSRNIEPTLRGVHIDFKEYSSINTKCIRKRDRKEVIGLVFMNTASLLLSKNEPKQASEYYLRALHYMPKDRLACELYGISLFLNGQKREARRWLKKALTYSREEEISPDFIAEDILEGNVDEEGLGAMLMPTDETRVSKQKKREALERSLAKNPKFREGLLEYASSLLELGSPLAAQEALEKLSTLSPDNIIVHTTLAGLWHDRYDERRARAHFLEAARIANNAGAAPKELKELRDVLFPLQ